MKEKASASKRKYTVGVRLSALPDIVTACPKCGGEVALWSEDRETAVCIFCDYRLFDRESTIH